MQGVPFGAPSRRGAGSVTALLITRIDKWIELGESRLTLNCIYRTRYRRIDKVRVTVHHDTQEAQSHARAYVLSDSRTWTDLVAAPPGTWWKPSMHPSDLEPVATELAKRACRILR